MAMTLGSRIQTARKKLNISQKDFAEKIGVSNVVMSRYENDIRTPDFEKLKLIANLLEVSTDYLLGNKSVNEVEPETLMFKVEGLDDISDEDKQRIEQTLIEQALFMIERSKKK